MRRGLLSPLLLLAALVIAPTLAAQRPGERPSAVVTPGAVVTTDTAVICRPRYATLRRQADSLTIARLRGPVYRRYGITKGGHHEFDHLIPLELGGASVRENLWPERVVPPWDAYKKDRLENTLRHLVCTGRMPLVTAQRAIAQDWIALYRQLRL